MSQDNANTKVVTTTCASHCGGSCLLRLHVTDGIIIRIETDGGAEPQIRACLRGRGYRQRVYAPDRILYPLRRAGERGEGKFERITWDEAISAVAGELTRVREKHGPEAILFLSMAGDVHKLNSGARIADVLAAAGGFTTSWDRPSFGGGIYAQRVSYGTHYTSNTRDDLVNSRFIILWGWNPAVTVCGVNTNWYLAQAKEAGAKIVAVDPRYTSSAATFADQWIPIRPGTDGAVLLAMVHVMIAEQLENRHFLETYTVGFERFRDYVTGAEDGTAKTPAWAETASGVPAATIEALARAYAGTKPAALMSGIAPGRTPYGEQYHRIAITLAAMTGNVGIHGGDAAGRAWESVIGGYPYQMSSSSGVIDTDNPVDQAAKEPPPGSPWRYLPSRMHRGVGADFILRGRDAGYPADTKMIFIVNSNYVNSFPNTNRITKALRSPEVSQVVVLEQFMTATARYADIILPTNTFFERDDITVGVGLPFWGDVKRAIESRGESKTHAQIASLLAAKLGVADRSADPASMLKGMADEGEIPDYEEFRKQGTYRIQTNGPQVAFEAQIRDSENHPFPTPSGKIEIYSRQVDELNRPEIPPIPKYFEAWEGSGDALAARYPLQLISGHARARANAQFANIPWLRELEAQTVGINPRDAAERTIRDGDMVRVFNDRGEILLPVRLTERIMPGVLEVPQGGWYDPDASGLDRGGCANVLTREAHSPGGAANFGTSLVQVEKSPA